MKTEKLSEQMVMSEQRRNEYGTPLGMWRLMSEQWSTLDRGCVWDIDGKLYRVIGRTGFSDGSTVDFHRTDNVTESPWPDLFCDVFYVRTHGKFVSRDATVSP